MVARLRGNACPCRSAGVGRTTRPSEHPHQPAEDMVSLATVICSPASNIAILPRTCSSGSLLVVQQALFQGRTSTDSRRHRDLVTDADHLTVGQQDCLGLRIPRGAAGQTTGNSPTSRHPPDNVSGPSINASVPEPSPLSGCATTGPLPFDPESTSPRPSPSQAATSARTRRLAAASRRCLTGMGREGTLHCGTRTSTSAASSASVVGPGVARLAPEGRYLRATHMPADRSRDQPRGGPTAVGLSVSQ